MQKSLHKWRGLVPLLTILFCFCSRNVFSQINFTFSTFEGSYNEISGTSIFAAEADDNISNSLFVGFTFYYAGKGYSEFRVSSNGWLSLGSNTTNSLPTNALTTINNGPIIAPLWDDLKVPAGNITYAATGSIGSRILTVQWKDARWNKNASGAVMSFQVKLYEGTNVIEFIYEREGTNSNSASASIGLNGGTSSTDFYSVSGNNGSAVATYNSETNWISSRPNDDRTYQWTPNNMFYVSSTTGQITGAVSKCNNLQQAIINVQVVTRGTVSPIYFTQLKFDIVTTAVADLSSIRVYYTGDASGFAPANEFGTGPITPVSGTITLNGSQKLVAGTNYFWIAYDINPSAVAAHTLDARCTEITVSSQAYAPTVTNPSSWRTITDCSAAPGGITGASFWVKADAGTSTTTHNGKVDTWNDQSGNARNATNTDADNQPTYYDNSTYNLNFNPVVDFNEAAQDKNNADFMDINSNGILSTGNNPYDAYAVIVPGAGNLSMPGKFLFAGEAGVNKFNSFDVRSGYSVNDSWNINDLIVGNSWAVDSLSMFTFDYNYNKRETYKAGSLIGSLTNASRTTANLNNALGYQRTAAIEYFDGRIAEIITYANTSHGTTTREKVESYLGIKYGVTLAHNYLASNSTIVWNRATNAAYNNNIIGIARDNNGALLQKQSKSTSSRQDILTVYIGPSKQSNQKNNTGNFTAGDLSFFMVGHNNDIPVNQWPGNTERPAGICCRIFREWLVQKTNFTNTDLKLEFDFNAVTTGYLPLNAADLRLLVDADGNFSNATILNTPGITINAAAGVATITVPASLLPNNSYFTLASVSVNTILPLELTAFSGLCKDQVVQLKWTTASPVQNDLIIERSTDKVNFSPVGTVKSNAAGSYTWTDKSPLPGTLYYRLQTTKDNGASLYSTIIGVSSCNMTTIQLSTNPVTNASTLMLQLSQNQQTEISLYDMLGRRFDVPGLTGKRSMTKGVHYIPVHIPVAATGMYLLHVNLNGDRHVYKILKK